jgi:hypothetical protein
MADQDTQHKLTDGGPGDGGPGLSRRQVVAAGVTGGLGVAALGSSVADAATGARAGVGPRGSTAVEFRARIEQHGITGSAFKSYGYLTRLTHTRVSQLFDGTPHNESSALLTAFATGDLKARVLDMQVHSLDIVGTFTVYQRGAGGADYGTPSSFRVGRQVARFDVRLQDVLTVYAAGQGLPTLTGDMVQTMARPLHGPLAGKTFGSVGHRLRMFATGLGQLVDPATFVAKLEIAGNWAVE